MAMAVRSGVGAPWRVVSNAVASTSAVRCAVEPGRRQTAGADVGLSGPSSGPVRCHAVTLTGVRELAEREVEMQRAALRGSFEAASVSGRAGAEDCHPACEQSRMHYGRRGGGDAFVRPAVEEAVGTGTRSSTPHRERVAAFEAALAGAGRNAEALCEMAMRAWRKLGDADRAEQLYLEALQIAPEDSAVQASYAQFLWQCDA